MLRVPRNTIVTLMGPTASGKTDLALRIADQLPVDIISVDSAMIYRDMNIGTAKPTVAVLARYPHRLIDLRDAAESYSVGEFIDDVTVCIAASLKSGRLPLLVGGTMLYFKAFKAGLADLPPASPGVRKQLERRARSEGLAALYSELMRVDPVAAAGIHPNNPQRLLRALEVYAVSGRPISDYWVQQNSRTPARHHGGVADKLGCRLVEFAIEPATKVIHARIERRLVNMLEAGLLDEVRALMERGDLSPELASMRTVGYRQVWQYLDGSIDHETMIAKVLTATRQLAKRQRTWLRSWSDKWVLNDSAEASLEPILQSIEADRIVTRSP